MRAMVLDAPRTRLALADVPEPSRGAVVEVKACGVCRTDLHIVDGELGGAKLPLVLGHQIVGVVDGQRVGVPWLGSTDGTCKFCTSGRENLCDNAKFTGYTLDGGYAELAAADERFCFPIPDEYDDVHAAPLLCAGLIGYRALRACGDPATLGIYGFGAAAHIVTQVAVYEGRRVFAFTRGNGDLARSVGASWVGASTDSPPEPLDAAIVFAPAGELVPVALRAIDKGGTVVLGGIHMSDVPQMSYEVLWGERVIRSVANLTRTDGEEFLALAPRVPVRVEVHTFALEQANDALDELRAGRVRGAAVLTL